MIKVLMVCHGNICRSPIAENIFKKLIIERSLSQYIMVASAATSDEEEFNEIHVESQKVMRKHGIPFTSHKARVIDLEKDTDWDYILYMDHYNKDALYEMYEDHENIHALCPEYEIDDPWYTLDFDKTYEEILEGCTYWMDKISATI